MNAIAKSILYGVSESAKTCGKYKLLRITDIQNNNVQWDTVPYTDLTENIASIDTLPKIMKNNGYKTVALHTYDKTFYDRDKNYANMGFDEFIGIDEFVPVYLENEKIIFGGKITNPPILYM